MKSIALSLLLLSFAPDALTVDPVHSFVNFRVSHLGASFAYGRFDKIEGKVSYDAKAPEGSSVELEIAADTVNTANEGRDKHLKSPDFFSVKEFPKITFKSTKVKKVDDKHLDVTGDLTLHGVTKPVTAKVLVVGSVTDPQFGKRTGFESTFTVKRSDYGMKFMTDKLGDEVQVSISIECTPAK